MATTEGKVEGVGDSAHVWKLGGYKFSVRQPQETEVNKKRKMCCGVWSQRRTNAQLDSPPEDAPRIFRYVSSRSLWSLPQSQLHILTSLPPVSRMATWGTQPTHVDTKGYPASCQDAHLVYVEGSGALPCSFAKCETAHVGDPESLCRASELLPGLSASCEGGAEGFLAR